MKRILVATDGSEGATRALAFAARLARDGGKLTIVNVADSRGMSFGELAELAHHERLTPADLIKSMSDQILVEAKQRAEELGASEILVESRFGEVATSIIEAARRDGVDLIVLGRRGLGRLAGLLVGSVSQKIVSVSKCTVAVVP